MNIYITMTREQTALYNSDDDREASEVMREMQSKAQAMANEIKAGVEIYTTDGIVADFCHPE